MREILFRGKNVDNGAWVYGSFIPDMLEVFCITDIDGFIKPFSLIKEELTEVRVERSTVGQFTGLTDKNGTRIFEGDIVKVENALVRGIFAVEYGMSASFIVSRGERRYLLGGCNSEVIGNIHDNPDLLKE